jgi:hypothetical protein
MKILLIISLISLSLCAEITLKATAVAANSGAATTKVDITLSVGTDPSLSGDAPSGLIKLKSTTGTSISLADCAFGNFGSGAITVTCTKGADGVYNLEETSVTSGSNTLKIDVSDLTKAIKFSSDGTTATDIAGNALTASKITKTDSGASITFQAATKLDEAHSVEGLFVVNKDTTKVSLTCSLASVAANTNSTATCTIPSNTAAGDYVLQANAGGVVSGSHKFTVALKDGITDADKTITISAAAGGAGGAGGADGTDNKADFISFSKYLFTIFILFL